MSFSRRHFHRTLLAAAAALASQHARADDDQDRDDADGDGGTRQGRIFTSTNAAAGNEVLVYRAAAGGALQFVARHPTQGLGSGAGLGSQGAVTLSGDGRWLFVVNAGSHTVSTFAVRPAGLVLASVQDSAGLRPVSVAENDGLVYVVNADGAGNIAGFRNQRGRLQPVAGSVKPLSAAGGTGAAQVGIGPDGDVVVVTEKATSRLTSYALGGDGSAGERLVTASSGATPFGFAFDRRGRVFVTEAPGSALSSYRFDGARPVLVSASVPNGQVAACWAVATPNGRFVYSANAGSGSVSAYRVGRDGSATLANAVAGSTGPNSGPVDMAIAPHGRTLAVLAGRATAIFTFTVRADGTLAPQSSVATLPAGSVGLAMN